MIRIDKRIYNDSCISKTIYSLSNEFTVNRHYVSDIEEELEIICGSSQSKQSFERKLINALNDFKLRAIIEFETRDIRTILYAKAFEEDSNLELPDNEYI